MEGLPNGKSLDNSNLNLSIPFLDTSLSGLSTAISAIVGIDGSVMMLDSVSDQNLIITDDISNRSSTPGIISDSRPDQEMELMVLLSGWKLETLATSFIAQNINVEILKIIKRHHIERLFKDGDMGTQILFEHHLEEWRASIGMPLNPYMYAPSRCCSGSQSPASSNASTVSFSYTPYEKPAKDSSAIPLSTILNGSSRGKMLVEYYTNFGKFQENQRTSLIAVIANYFQDNGSKMTLAASYELEKEIIQRFPSEKLDYYRSNKRGKIYSKYCNLKASFQTVAAGNKLQAEDVTQAKATPRCVKIFEPETDAESCLRALKFDNLTSEQFDSTWKACSKFRLQYIQGISTSTDDILVKWPFYKLASGYRLIDMDFKIAFENDGGLLNGWPESFEKIRLFLTEDGHIKDRNIKKLLDGLMNQTTLSENGQNAALIWALHGYLVPTSKVVKKDLTGKKSTTKFTIKDSQESVIFLGASAQEVEEHILHLKRTKIHIQPFIFCIGKDIFSVEEIFVNFDNIRYQFTNIIRALDICFKIIFLFNLEFPGESDMFYSFLETSFFKMKSKNKYAKVQILAEYLSV